MPHVLPVMDPVARDAAWAEMPWKPAIVPEDVYDCMMDHYAVAGPKNYKYRLHDLNGTVHVVRFRKDVGFYFEKGGVRYMIMYNNPRVANLLGDIPTREQMDAIRDANYTGNHYRNHTVRAPTAPGQPVWG